MSRPIKLTQELIDECRQDFEKALSLTKLSDGKLSFTKAFSCGDRKAVVYFSAEAWAKMTMLIKEFDKEVAWHGDARRTEDESLDEYVIDDIVVYPQEVTGATVEMDTEKYALWIQENIEDERFNHIYMQGHSHVNMGTSPSSVDLNHQEESLGMLGDNDFYIFMIWNKSFASTNKIYDLKKNVMFEDKDITVKIIGQNEGLDEFIKNAKDMVKSKSYAYGGQSGYGGYYNQGYKMKKDLLNSMNFTHDEAAEETPVSACGITLGVVTTVRVICALGVSNFVKYIRGKGLNKLIICDSFQPLLDAF